MLTRLAHPRSYTQQKHTVSHFSFRHSGGGGGRTQPHRKQTIYIYIDFFCTVKPNPIICCLFVFHVDVESGVALLLCRFLSLQLAPPPWDKTKGDRIKTPHFQAKGTRVGCSTVSNTLSSASRSVL